MRNLYRLVLALLLMAPLSAIAQITFSGKAVNPATQRSLAGVFRKYTLFSIGTEAVNAYMQAHRGEEVRFTLRLPGYPEFPLALRENDLLSAGYRLTTDGQGGRQSLPKPAPFTYSGRLSDEPGSSAALAITDQLLHGLVSTGGRRYFIEPLRYLEPEAPQGLFVVYEASDLVPHPELLCTAGDALRRAGQLEQGGLQKPTAPGANDTCRLVELAVASDMAMYRKYGSTAAVQEYTISVWNMVLAIYYNAQIGPNYLEFKIVSQYVATTAAANPQAPYTGTDAGTILGNFRLWAQAGGFGALTYDIGQLWTTVDIDGGSAATKGVIGLAYVGASCTGFRYQLIEEAYGLSTAQQMITVAHETGHNLGANHDAANSPYIMAPSVGNPPATTFSSTSLTDINTYLFTNSGASCFSPCNATLPTAQFNASPQGVCSGTSITFTDYSAGKVLSRSWSFPGGTPATSTAASQTVSYASPGLRAVTLTATNSAGSSSVTKNVFVGTAPPAATCTSSSTGDTAKPIYLGLTVASIRAFLGSYALNGFYHDVSCTQTTALSAGSTYVAQVRTGLLQSGVNYTGKAFLFLDYNNDGDFLDAGETLSLDPSCAQGVDTIIFTTPATPPVVNTWLRLRVVTVSCYSPANSTDGCAIPSNAQTEDYGVYFASPTQLPLSLLSFTGRHEGGKNLLSWEMAAHSGTDYYEVERSANGKDFAALGKVYGSQSARSYSFTDDLSGAGDKGLFYYRLKMVAEDGGYRYSSTLLLNGDGSPAPLSFYPNPVRRGESLTIQTQGSAPAKITVFNGLGQAVYSAQIPAGGYGLAIPEGWPAGVYLLQVADGGGLRARPFVVR